MAQRPLYELDGPGGGSFQHPVVEGTYVQAIGKCARPRVLVVDDEPALVGALRIILKDVHDVFVATDGRSGIERIVTTEVPFDAILCDLSMPGTTGMDLYEEVRLRRPGIERRIIFMTGGAFTPRAVEFLAGIPNVWIEKPFEVESMNEALRGLIGAPSG